jgi:hypothetical protein
MNVSEIKDFLRMCKCGDFVVMQYHKEEIPSIVIFKEYDDETSTLTAYADTWLDILCKKDRSDTILADFDDYVYEVVDDRIKSVRLADEDEKTYMIEKLKTQDFVWNDDKNVLEDGKVLRLVDYVRNNIRIGEVIVGDYGDADNRWVMIYGGIHNEYCGMRFLAGTPLYDTTDYVDTSSETYFGLYADTTIRYATEGEIGILTDRLKANKLFWNRKINRIEPDPDWVEKNTYKSVTIKGLKPDEVEFLKDWLKHKTHTICEFKK